MINEDMINENMLLILWHSIYFEDDPDNVTTTYSPYNKMASCSYNHEHTIICDNGSQIRNLTSDDIDNLHFDEILGVGSFSVVYSGYIGDYPVAIKIIKNTNLSKHQLTSYDTEICNQQKASTYHLAPSIIGYWVCPTEHIFIMDHIRGMLFEDIINQSNILEIFAELIRQVVFQNQVLGIIHGDLNDHNIFITNDRILFIDYGFSTSYPGPNILYERLRNGSDFSEFLIDLVQWGRLLRLILPESNLNQVESWQQIYKEFFNHYGRIPNYKDIYGMVRDMFDN